MKPGTKHLIVNADDFGQSPGINRGIIQAHENGIVTSASLMTRWPAAREAALYAKEHPKLSLGLHLDLGEWVYRQSEWLPVYTVVPLEDGSAVEREVARQLDAFRCLVGRDPSHVNSHQHVHMREPLRSITVEVAGRLGVPLRNLSTKIHYSLQFYGQTNEGLPFPTGIQIDRLIDMLSHLPPGLTVMACHPGDASDLNTTYRKERAEEVRVLCDARVRSAITNLGIILCSFDNWKDMKISPIGQQA